MQGDEGRWYDQANFYGILDCIGTPITRPGPPYCIPMEEPVPERDASCPILLQHILSHNSSPSILRFLFRNVAETRPCIHCCCLLLCETPFPQLLPGCSCTYSCMFANTKAYSSDNIDRSLTFGLAIVQLLPV